MDERCPDQVVAQIALGTRCFVGLHPLIMKLPQPPESLEPLLVKGFFSASDEAANLELQRRFRTAGLTPASSSRFKPRSQVGLHGATARVE